MKPTTLDAVFTRVLRSPRIESRRQRMYRKNTLSRWLTILMFSASSQSVLADPAADLARAEEALRSGDLIATIPLFKKAADAGYAPAQARLGEILDYSEFDEEAISWFKKAADQGNPAGEFGLGRMYAQGEGIQQDSKKAVELFTRAANKDFIPAIQALANAYRTGTLGLPVDPAQAKTWDDKALAVKKAQPEEAKTGDKK